MHRTLQIVLCLFAMMLMAGAVSAAPGDPGCEFDFDGDGTVTQEDLNYCFGLLQIFPPGYNPTCDTDGDGILSTVDFLPILVAIESNLDCTALVPSGSLPSRGLLLGGLILASALALRFGPVASQKS